MSDPRAGCVANVLSIVVAYGALTAILQSACSAVEVFRARPDPASVRAGEDDNRFVIPGLVTCARVTAALIMVFVFGSFRLNGNPPVKQIGVGLTVAVILEVTAVR